MKSKITSTIRFLNYADIPKVESILALQFGKGYMDTSAIEQFVNQKNLNGLVAEHKGEIVGVAFARTFPIQNINQHLNLNLVEGGELFPTQRKLGITNSMATLPSFTGKGIGNALMAERMKWLEKNCEAAICMCWEESNGGMEKLLIKNKFQYIQTIPEYWKEESITSQFTCTNCGAPPCLCSGSIYVKYFD